MPRPRKLDLSPNQILTALPEKIAGGLLPHLELVSAKLGQVLFRSGDPARYIYFPLDCAISLIASLEDGRDVEVSLVGAEGLVGIWSALGSKTDRYEGVVQVPGRCLRISADAFRAVLRGDSVLLDRLHLYTRYVLAQIAQTAACNRVHRLEQRLSRWLLMTHSRARKAEFPATHEFLAHMLGTDRSEVTIAAGILRKAGLISYSRGIVKILDRVGLESAACECYQAGEKID